LGDATNHESNEHKGGEEDATMTTREYISGDNYESRNIATMTVNAGTPPEVCVDVGQGHQYSEREVVPSPPMEDIGHTSSDAMVTSCREGKLGAHGPHMEQQRPNQVPGESGALPELD